VIITTFSIIFVCVFLFHDKKLKADNIAAAADDDDIDNIDTKDSDTVVRQNTIQYNYIGF
jgi:hypothetical protein